MNKLFLLFTLAFILTACNEKKQKEESDSNLTDSTEVMEVDLEITEPEIEEIPALNKCYTLKDGNTDAELNLVLEDGVVTGNLTYTGDVSRTGSLTGDFSGDTLVMSYKFSENGQTKVEEMILLEDKDKFTLQLGSTEMVENDGFKTIKDKSSVTFEDPVFKKYDCLQE
jgi:hypothetical protein